MNTVLAVAGIAIELAGDGRVADLAAPYRAFTARGDEGHRLRLDVVVDPKLDVGEHPPRETSVSSSASLFRLRQPGIRFELDRETGRGAARVDGGDTVVRHLVELVLGATLWADGGLLVHAACGVDAGGEAWLVPGPSGAGKSTSARNAGFARVLADEKVALRPRDGGFDAWGTPFWSVGRALPYDSGRAPVRRLVRPIQSGRDRLGPLAREAALAWLVRCVVLAWDHPAVRRATFETACEVVRGVQCETLEFTREGAWLKTARSPNRRTSEFSRPRTTRSASTGISPGGATTSASTATSPTDGTTS